jgi:hypothetical protein
MLDRMIRNSAVKIARPAHRIEPDRLLVLYIPIPEQHHIPKFANLLPPPKLIPSRLQPPKPSPPLEGEPANRLHTGSVECILPVSRQKS